MAWKCISVLVNNLYVERSETIGVIFEKGEPMIYSDGYSLTYFPKRNTIEIVMPQTMTTLTNTVTMVSNRKIVLTEAEETAILSVVKAIVERRTDGM